MDFIQFEKHYIVAEHWFMKAVSLYSRIEAILFLFIYRLADFLYSQNELSNKLIHRPSTRKIRTCSKSTQVSILSQNTFLIFTSWPDAGKRIPQFIEELRSLEYDIVCLQECFSSKMDSFVLKALLDGLSDMYPYHVKHTDPISLKYFVDSGLLIFSKQPIVSHSFTRFSNGSGPDALSDKGVMMAHIKIPDQDGNEKSLVIANTHFNAGYSSHASSRFEQSLISKKALNEFMKSIESQVKEDISQIPVFCAGDFNAVERHTMKQGGKTKIVENEEYRNIMENLGPGTKDLYRLIHGDEPLGYTFHGFQSAPFERLDYIFGLSGDYKVVDAGIDKFVLSGKVGNLSDHLGSYAIIELTSNIRQTISGADNLSVKDFETFENGDKTSNNIHYPVKLNSGVFTLEEDEETKNETRVELSITAS